MVEQWEYRSAPETMWNRLGFDSWELVSVTTDRYGNDHFGHFKRRIAPSGQGEGE